MNISNKNNNNNNLELKLKEEVKSLFNDFQLIIGYCNSGISFRVKPLFIYNLNKDKFNSDVSLKEFNKIEKLVFNKFCINNLAVYSYFKAKEIEGKIAIVLKPCDLKSIIQLISEELVKKDKIYAIVLECSGVIDYKKIQKFLNGEKIVSVKINDDNQDILLADTINKSFNINISDFYADKCYDCKIHTNPPYADMFIKGDTEKDLKFQLLKRENNSSKINKDENDDIGSNVIKNISNINLLKELESSSFDKIVDFWNKEFERCIRCYACRNICPLEVCRDQCIAQLDCPRWQSQQINSQEGKFFQLIRVVHLAGRCTECGECERACPENIPILTLMRKMNKEIFRLFNFSAGLSIDEKPPLLTYKSVEENIHEEEIL